MNILTGYRTYIVAILMVIVSGLAAQGYITDHQLHTIEGILLGGGLAALRASKGP